MFGGCLFGSCNLCYLQLGRCVNQDLRQLLDIMANKKWSRKSKMSNWPSTEWVWRTNLELMSISRTDVIENKYKNCYLCSELFLGLNWIKRVMCCKVHYKYISTPFFPTFWKDLLGNDSSRKTNRNGQLRADGQLMWQDGQETERQKFHSCCSTSSEGKRNWSRQQTSVYSFLA